MKTIIATTVLVLTASAFAWAGTCYTNCYRDFQGNQHCTTTCH